MSEKSKEMERRINRRTGVVHEEVSVSIPVSGFPTDLWNIWDKQCQKHYHNIRWAKVWSDHLKAQSYDLLVKSEFQVIEKEVVQEEGEAKEEKEEEGLGLLNPEHGGK